MSILHRLSATWGAGGALIGGSVSVSADKEENVSHLIPDNTANYALEIAAAAGKLKSLFIEVSAPCTLYVNDVSGGSPTDTVNLTPDAPFQWIKASGMRIPFAGTAGAITNLYITTPNSTPDVDVQLELRATIDF